MVSKRYLPSDSWYLVSIRDNRSLKTLKTSPGIYTSVCFESQTVASNYQKFPNNKSHRLRYGHKNHKYQSVGYQSQYGECLLARYLLFGFCEVHEDIFFAGN
jgi:hypothetical protein